MNLKHLAQKHGTDKFDHGYMPFYEKHLPSQVNSLLEIGVKQGASMRVWREAYPKAALYGMDLFQEFSQPDIEGVHWIKGNQLDHELLYTIRNTTKPQVIIDDASHNSRDQWVTLLSLIDSCEYYFIEDLHCCTFELYRQGLSFEHTILGTMQVGTFPFNFTLSEDQKIAVIFKK